VTLFKVHPASARDIAHVMDDYRTILKVADRLIAWHEVDKAGELLEKYLRKKPGHPELLRRLGRIRLVQRRPREAAALLEQAVAHDRMMAPLREDA
jgi:hypothetical protein